MTVHIQTIGVILAGGKSRRMGEDKALLNLKGQRLIERVYHRLAAQCGSVLISGDQDYELGVEVIPDLPDIVKGPVGAIYAVWHHLSHTTVNWDIDGFFTVPVDGPNLPDDFCKIMSGEGSAILFSEGWPHPTFAYWKMSDLSCAFEGIETVRSMSLRALSELCKARHVHGVDPTAVLNLNTQDDVAKWLQ